MGINRPYIVDEETKPVFNHKQGSDGTYWVGFGKEPKSN